MKIALCLSGKFTGRSDRGDIQGFKIPFEYLKKNVLNNNDIDIFLHGWDDDPVETKTLLNLYDPKKYIVEKQINFNHPFKHYDFIPSGPEQTKKCIDRIYSRYYSFKKSIELVNEDEYDLIFYTRFDVIFYKKIDFTMINPDNFYTSNWKSSHTPWGFNDVYFMSNPKIMKSYSLIYDNLYLYFDIENSDYYKFLLSHNKTLKNLQSMHCISRYRAKEMGIDNIIYGFGDRQLSCWDLLRFHNPQRLIDDVTPPPKKMYNDKSNNI